jgi:ATP phosphoribosyltransferase
MSTTPGVQTQAQGPAGAQPLRVAVPNKGSLSQAASDMLREAGYKQRHDAKQLSITDTDNGVEFYYLRPRDIALYVGEGTLDLGITGRDLLLDSGAKADEILPLGFGRSTFRFAAPPGVLAGPGDLAGKRIATSYAGIVARHLQRQGVEATLIRLDGAVETSISLGVADVIADVVETGSTLRQAGLELAGEVILASEAVLVSRPGTRDHPGREVFLRRLQGVLVARA